MNMLRNSRLWTFFFFALKKNDIGGKQGHPRYVETHSRFVFNFILPCRGGNRSWGLSSPFSKRTQGHTYMRPVNLPQLTTVINVWKDQVHIHHISVSSEKGKERKAIRQTKWWSLSNRKMPSGREACINQQCAKRKTSWGTVDSPCPCFLTFRSAKCRKTIWECAHFGCQNMDHFYCVLE